MKNRAKVLSVLLSGAMAFTMASCGGANQGTESKDASSYGSAGQESAAPAEEASSDASGAASMSGPGGGGPPASNAPDEAVIYIENGKEQTANEYTDKQAEIADGYTGVASGDAWVIKDMDMTASQWTTNGIIGSGGGKLRIEDSNFTFHTDESADASKTGGDIIAVDKGTALYLSNDTLTVNGAQRHAVANWGNPSDDEASGDAELMVVNDSTITATGAVGANDADVSEPPSNGALLIYGKARANFSVGQSATYYFNSKCTSEGWGALSTDSAMGNGLDLYAYNTDGIAQGGGYGAYADTNCRVHLYGSRLSSGEIGMIISNNGLLEADDAQNTPDTVLQYDEGTSDYTGQSVVAGRRNAVMMHSPDMMGQGAKSTYTAQIEAKDTLFTTDTSQDSSYFDGTSEKEDYASKYGDATAAYVDYVKGAVFLVKSTSADIELDNVTLHSGAEDNALVKTVVNSDSMGNFLADGDGEKVDPVTVSMTNMEADGNIFHMDYQRRMELQLGEGATLTGAVVGGTFDDWENLWKDYADDDSVNWLPDDSWTTNYGVTMTVANGAVWNVDGDSNLASLTIEKGGKVQAANGGELVVTDENGNEVTLEEGNTYTNIKLVTK